ncbi:hypothetical protein HQ576_17165 [bacterium]|nr:hypothetical protein [bacterium]
MRLLSFLFGSLDHSRDWTRDPTLDLTLDLDANTLNGVAIGAPVDGLAMLGRMEDRYQLRQQRLAFHSLGLALRVDPQGRLWGVEVFVGDDSDMRYEPFAGTILYRGHPAPLAVMDEDAAHQVFGEPYWRDGMDEDEVVLFYEHPAVEWQLEFRGDPMRLQVLTVTEERVMASPEQRTLYGVTAPWPPGVWAVSDSGFRVPG